MLRNVCLLVALLVVLGNTPGTADTCGSGGRCAVENGYYLAELPAAWDGKRPLPLVVFFHGWNASPEDMIRNRALVNSVTRRNAIFVAPYAERGAWRQAGEGRAQSGRDELAYVKGVVEDVKRRWPVDSKHMLAAGFSLGGSMTWNVACFEGRLFTAYLPIAGGFWHSVPDTCPSGPVNLRHIHGLKDGVVEYDWVGPYGSMPIMDALELARHVDGCSAKGKEMSPPSKGLDCTHWDGCSSGRGVEICLHPGGHSINGEWLGEGLDWMMSLK